MTRRNTLAFAVCAAALMASTGCSESTKDEVIVPAGTWTATGSLAVPRAFGHVATLASGKVLVAGGEIARFPSGISVASVEIYDPAAGTWTTVAPMATPRIGHCLVRLPSGKVLMAGGNDEVELLVTAEVYDPATDTWTPTAGPMTSAHNWPGCVLLDSGKVLIAGGWNGVGLGPSTVAEQYDPDTGLFTPTGSLAVGRGMHTATLLASGKVLVAGGCTDNALLYSTTSAELYDPATGSWSDAGSMPFPVLAHTATRLASGKVLVAGGCLAYRGVNSCANLDRDRRASLYDPVAGTWSASGSLSVGRQHYAVLLLDSGEVLVAGGTFFSGGAKSTERYDPATGRWTAGPPTVEDHGSGVLSAKLPDGRWMVVGGTRPPYPPQTYTGAAEIFTP